MLAPRTLPDEYARWNARWGAPSGYRTPIRAVLNRTPVLGGLLRRRPNFRGPFGHQVNNDTRAFEYPWSFFATPLERGMRSLDIGGSLAGFQFVLDRTGLESHNCDPGEAAHGVGWTVTPAAIDRLNRAFGTSVELHNCFLQDAKFPDATFDRVFSVSTIEHIPPSEIPGMMKEIARILRPGGMFVATVDLFLDLHPFTDRRENRFGTNIDIRALCESSGLRRVVGDAASLFGFPEFNARSVQARLDELLVGRGYPVLVQCIVLKKE
ncbi:MAG: class I SAM-dependent methyltransferase [Phycisphaerales bacterium]